jgi:hypothetical protein
MRTVWCVLLLVAACERGRDDKTVDKTPTLPTAVGSLELHVTSPAVMDTMIATELEVIRSASVVRMLNEKHAFDLEPKVVRATRRGRTAIIDVHVSDADSGRATRACDFLIRTYLSYRAGRAKSGLGVRLSKLAAELELRPDDAELRREVDALGEQFNSKTTSEDRLVGPCKLGSATSVVDPPRSPVIPGSFMLEPLPADAAAKAISTAIERLRSDALIDSTNERVRTYDKGIEVTRAAIHATRRGDSSIIDVVVDDPDALRSATLSNMHIESYLEDRFAQRVRENPRAEPDASVLEPARPLSSGSAAAVSKP